MIRLLATVFLGAFLLGAEDKWEECRSGPFEVWTNDSERKTRELLVRLEQIRYMLGSMLGKQDPPSTWTIRVLLLKNKPAGAGTWVAGRDAWVSALQSNAPISRAWQREVTKMLFESAVRRMPPEWESGIIDFLSTLEAQGPKVTLGNPLPANERHKGWARVHYLMTNPELTGRLRVLLNNLQNGGDEDVAYRNSFGQTKAEIDKQVDQYVAAGKFTPVVIGARAMSEKDFYTRPVETPRATASLMDAVGDWRLAAPGTMEAAEAQGLAAAREGKKTEASDWLKQAIAAGSRSPRVHLEYGKMLDDPEARRKAFVEAAKLNVKWSQPYVELANTEKAPERQAFYLKTAASLDPRNSDLWKRLGLLQLEAGEFAESSKSFFNAELAAPDAKSRELVREARRRFEEERQEREANERKRVADEKQKELDRLKQEALDRIREAEIRANAGQTASTGKVEAWWDDKNPPVKVAGVLEKVDCIGKQARVWIRPQSGKPLALLIKDPGQVVIIGGGEQAFGCGVQKPARGVNVEYRVRADAKLATAGDVALMEFR